MQGSRRSQCPEKICWLPSGTTYLMRTGIFKGTNRFKLFHFLITVSRMMSSSVDGLNVEENADH